jgi:hypothetical protein
MMASVSRPRGTDSLALLGTAQSRDVDIQSSDPLPKAGGTMPDTSRIDHPYAAITIAELRAALADLPAHYEVWFEREDVPDTADPVTALSVRVIDNAVILRPAARSEGSNPN